MPVKNNLENISKEYVMEINKIFADKLKKIILYGSYARGDYDEYSDIDIMILVDMPRDEIKKKWDNVMNSKCDMDNKYDVFLSPIIKDINQFNYYLPVLPFYQNIIKDGVVWYE